MKIAALGRTEILYNSVIEVNSSFDGIGLIVTDEAESHYGKDSEDFRELADEIGAQFICTSNIENYASQLKEFDIAISVNWKTIIPPSILDSFRIGALNYHAGDLPRYRGNAPANWAIIEGEEAIVHTIHEMTRELDAGPICLQRATEIEEDTYIGDIFTEARKLVPDMFIETIEGLRSNSLIPREQSDNPEDVLRCYPRKPQDSRIDWTDSAQSIHRLIRASAEPLFGAYTFYNGEKLRIWRASTTEPPTPYLGTPGQVAKRRPDRGSVEIITGNGFLEIQELEINNDGRKSATEVITSNRDRLGKV